VTEGPGANGAAGGEHVPQAEAAGRLDEVVADLSGGGEHREGQREMAEAVAATIADDGHAAIQAGTGTGKSLAYLVPALLSDAKTVVATATLALQDQLVGKDLPFVVERLFVRSLKAPSYTVLKGRSNYVCLQRLDEVDAQASLDLDDDDAGADEDAELDADTVAEVRKAVEDGGSGDREQLGFVSDWAWRQISVSSEECPGAAHCPRGEDCCAEKARERAHAADLVVVNHKLYALDLVLDGSILGAHDTVVVDEAHQFEQTVADTLGCEISAWRVRRIGRSAASVLARSNTARAMERHAIALEEELENLGEQRLRSGPGKDLTRTLERIRTAADRLLCELRAVPEGAPPEAQAKARRARRLATSLIDDLDTVADPADNDVVWVSGGLSPVLRCTPIRIDETLGERLWDTRSAVLTSATLPTGSTASLGLPEGTLEADVGSPFDYRSNALLYCPAGLPEPKDQDLQQVCDEIEALMSAAQGRTLGLFTSFARLRDTTAEMRERLQWPVLMQGDAPKQELLQKFVAEPETSLFATMSFWQGVDAPGSTCSLVIIDRIPFPTPSDPVLQARREQAGDGYKGWRQIDLPRAATLLAQGAGRLIRTATDQGVVAVLDPRLANKSYRWDLINALPPMTRTKDRAEAEQFLRSATVGG